MSRAIWTTRNGSIAPHPTPLPAPGADGTVPTLAARPPQRMAARRAQVEYHGKKLADAIEAAYAAACELSYAMPIWSDLTQDAHVALGERGTLWSMLEVNHQELLTLARQLRDLRASGAWAAALHERIPEGWHTGDSLNLIRSPEAWGLTAAQAAEIEQERRETFARMADTAALLAQRPATTPQPTEEPTHDAV